MFITNLQKKIQSFHERAVNIKIVDSPPIIVKKVTLKAQLPQFFQPIKCITTKVSPFKKAQLPWAESRFQNGLNC